MDYAPTSVELELHVHHVSLEKLQLNKTMVFFCTAEFTQQNTVFTCMASFEHN